MTSLFNLFAALALPALLVTQWLWPLYRNYRRAQKSGLPILISPFNPDNVRHLPGLAGPLVRALHATRYPPAHGPYRSP